MSSRKLDCDDVFGAVLAQCVMLDAIVAQGKMYEIYATTMRLARLIACIILPKREYARRQSLNTAINTTGNRHHLAHEPEGRCDLFDGTRTGTLHNTRAIIHTQKQYAALYAQQRRVNHAHSAQHCSTIKYAYYNTQHVSNCYCKY